MNLEGMQFRSKYLLKSSTGLIFDIQTSLDGRYIKLMTGTTGNMQAAMIEILSSSSDFLRISCDQGELTIPLTRAADVIVGIAPPKPMFYPRSASLPEVLTHLDPQDVGHIMQQNMVCGYIPTKGNGMI